MILKKPPVWVAFFVEKNKKIIFVQNNVKFKIKKL